MGGTQLCGHRVGTPSVREFCLEARRQGRRTTELLCQNRHREPRQGGDTHQDGDTTDGNLTGRDATGPDSIRTLSLSGLGEAPCTQSTSHSNLPISTNLDRTGGGPGPRRRMKTLGRVRDGVDSTGIQWAAEPSTSRNHPLRNDSYVYVDSEFSTGVRD